MENNRYILHQDMFSKLSSSDLLELLVEIENMYIEFRKKLLFNYPNLTFGIEIEYESVSRKIVSNFIKKNFSNWNSIGDESLKSGGEIISPVLNTSDCNWEAIESICNFLKHRNANMCNRAGEHIHIGRQVLDSVQKCIDFAKFYIVSEPVLFRFGYGDKVSARKKIFKYASPAAYDLYKLLPRLEKCTTLEEAYSLLETVSRYTAVNFSNILSKTDKKTIEFRFFNATASKAIVQNNIYSIVNFSTAPSRGLIDYELIDYELEKLKYSELEFNYKYNEICLEDALLFVDQVFDNNISKMYCLKQYIKGYQNNFGIKNAVYAKKMYV